MNYFRYPFLVLVLSFVVLWLSARIGVSFRKRRRNLEEDEREDFGIIVAAVLTLLGLIIGFSFSMAVSRYDQRKNYEEAEANAIGTEYVRQACSCHRCGETAWAAEELSRSACLVLSDPR
jgi:hypothetical protein